MRTVWKYVIPIDGGIHEFVVPLDAELAHVGQQEQGYVTMWLVIDSEQPKQVARFQVVGTGFPIPENWEHVGTVQEGAFVWHLFEEVQALESASAEFGPTGGKVMQ